MSRPAANSALSKAVLAALKGDAAIACAKVFSTEVAGDVTPDELPQLTTAELAGNLADFWRFGERRRGRNPTIRISPVLAGKPVGLDRLEIVQDDAPFLVDSIMGEIAEQGLSVRALFHPIVEVQRDRAGIRGTTGEVRRESMIQVILDSIGADREAALIRGLTQTLQDVRAAVEDFPEMLGLMSRTQAELQVQGQHARPEEIAFLSWLEAAQFVFLGARVYEYPKLKNGDYAPEEPLYQAKD